MVQCICGDVFRAQGSHTDVSAKEREWCKVHENCGVPTEDEPCKVFWLSFCDSTLATGKQFLGACLVYVSVKEAEKAAIEVAPRFPLARSGAGWIAAAIKKAHQLGCNPGGEVATCEIEADNPNLCRYPPGVLMDRATLDRIEEASDV